jgi:hypothetical protein
MTPFPGNIGFNAHHSPMGAYFTFTCGNPGSRGGLAAQLGKPADQDLYIGFKEGDRYQRSPLHVLPFFSNADKLDPATAFLPEMPGTDRQTFAPFPLDRLTRSYGWSTDRWNTRDGLFEFTLYTPFGPIPNPTTADPAALRSALLPAIIAELIIDNRAGTTPRTGFFAINFNDGGCRILEGLPPGRAGFAFRAPYGVTGDLVDMTAKGSPVPVADGGAFTFLRWWPHEGLEDRSNPIHLLGTTPGIGFEVPPGKKYGLRLALGCYLAGVITTRLEGRYLYTRHYATLLDVLNTAADAFCDLKQRAREQDDRLASSGLSPDQQFLIAHATRSYYGNTELLEVEGEPYWIVNEGEYCMMNTLDLAADQVFWELEQNPWVVRNLLDNFLKRYSYVDEVKIENGPASREQTAHGETSHGKTSNQRNSVPPMASKTAPGGLSFCHDQGTHNQFSPFGHSAYELKDLTGCFSYMTQEQLCNWILIAASYVAKTGDRGWLSANGAHVQHCLESMVARRPAEGNWMYFDSALCGSGQEITTYDSLDTSLGQARSNSYLAIMCWAAYMGLRLLSYGGADQGGAAHLAGNEAEKLEWEIAALMREKDALPAVYERDNPGLASRILPVLEGLVYPLVWNAASHVPKGMKRERLVTLDADTPLHGALCKHIVSLLADPQHRNKFPDDAGGGGGGGIKLSSTSDNTWLSKIAIVQHVARTLFNLDENGNQRPPNARASGWEKADAAHVHWLTRPESAYWAASDQMINGIARGSKYYPRLITAALWLRE